MSHLDVEVAAYDRGDMQDDPERVVDMACDLLIADAVPAHLNTLVADLIKDGRINARGDRT